MVNISKKCIETYKMVVHNETNITNLLYFYSAIINNPEL